MKLPVTSKEHCGKPVLGLVAGRRRKFISIINIFLLSTLLVCLDWNTASAKHAYVLKVLDGDSLRVRMGGKTLEIRLYGIDAPEYGQRYGTRSKKYAQGLANKVTVTVVPKDMDQYGRIVAVVRSHGRMVNRELVRNGYAWVYPKYCLEEPLCSDLKEMELEARKHNRGLWKAKSPEPPWEWKQRRRSR